MHLTQNPFQQIEQRFDYVERLANEILQRIPEKENVRTLLTSKEAAEFLGIQLSSLYALTSKNEISFYKRSKMSYFKREELEQFILSHKVKSNQELLEGLVA